MMDTNKHGYTLIRQMMRGDPVKWTSDDNQTIFFEYYEYLCTLGIKPITVEQHLFSIYLLICYMENKSYIFESLCVRDVNEFGCNLTKISSNPNYRSRKLTDIRRFLDWCYEHNYTLFSGSKAFPTIKWHKNINIMSFYSDYEIQCLLDSYDVSTSKGKEQYLLISLITMLGLRVSDAVNLKISQIDFANKLIKLQQFKTSSELVIPISDDLQVLIADYLHNIRPTDCNLDYLFVTTTKPYRHKAELRSHYHIVASHFKSCGIDIASRKHGFHALRHSFSSRMLNANTSVYDVSKMLGHTSVEVTNRYLNVDLKIMKELSLEVPLHEF